ncbi:MAG: B12-binding domain-containing radical SAM protein [Desulfobaccales bacterium]
MHPPLRNVLGAATPDYIEENRGCNPPMGLLYLQAAIERSRHESIFLDANLEGWTHEVAARAAISHEPDLIGLQAMTFTLRDAYLLARAIKKLNPEAQVILGGPHPTIYPKETAGLEDVDFAFAGEAEIGLVEFLDKFHDPEARVAVPGIAGKKNGIIRYTPSSGLLQDLDRVPFPARRSSPYQRYSSILARRNPVTIMMTSRGCPFSCIFCNRMGRRYRCHSAAYVLAEVQEIVDLGIKEIFIHDDTFTLNRDRVEAICQGLIQRRYDLVWEARTRLDLVDEELLNLMARAGCQRLSFGVESGSARVLESMRKAIQLDRAEKVFSWCRQAGIVTLADFMLGNLNEELEDIQKTFDLVKKLDPDYVQFSICSPYPDTPLYALGRSRGLIPRDVWLDFAKDPLKEFASPVWTENFSEEELRRLIRQAYRAFYLRPKFIWKEFTKINSLSQLKLLSRTALQFLFLK